MRVAAPSNRPGNSPSAPQTSQGSSPQCPQTAQGISSSTPKKLIGDQRLKPYRIRPSTPSNLSGGTAPQPPQTSQGTVVLLKKSSKSQGCRHGVTVGGSCSIKMSFHCLKQKQGLNCKRIKTTPALCCSPACLLLVFSPGLTQNGRISQMALLQH